LKGILHREDDNKHSHYRIGIIEPQGKSRQVTREKHRMQATKWQEITTHISILTPNVKGLISPIQRHCLANQIKKKMKQLLFSRDPAYNRNKHCLRVKG
jgi:hypothetical protein